MKKKDWFDDFMDYKMSSSSDEKPSNGSGGGLSFVIGLLIILWLLSNFFD